MNSEAMVNKKDQILMQLAHYFITVENYTPIVVRGVQNELWLENIDAPYRIIRINTNYIHNNEQLDYDLFKIKNIVKQVKRKTLSLSIKTLNILIDVGNNVTIKSTDKIDCIAIDSVEGIKNTKEIISLYPNLELDLLDAKDGIDFLINVTNDINKKTERESREFEKVFKKKNINLTYIFMIINLLIFVIGNLGILIDKFDLFSLLALKRQFIQAGQIHRLITACFTHSSLFHFVFNMYALYTIGTQVETYLGKKKYFVIYIFSGIIGSFLSCITKTGWSLGASGAIFGLMGTLLYFGYHYRLYLDKVLRTQIIPLIVTNLLFGLVVPTIGNSAHIGGLVGGLFITMALGIDKKSSKEDRINGIICSTILLIFLIYMTWFIK